MRKLFLILFIIPIYCNSQNFNIGDFINPNTSDFKLEGIIVKENSKIYSYNKKLNPKFNHKLNLLYIKVNNNKIASITYILQPLPNEKGVSKELIKKLEKNINAPAKFKDDFYMLANKKVAVMISRRIVKEYGGDIILLYYTLRTDN